MQKQLEGAKYINERVQIELPISMSQRMSVLMTYTRASAEYKCLK